MNRFLGTVGCIFLFWPWLLYWMNLIWLAFFGEFFHERSFTVFTAASTSTGYLLWPIGVTVVAAIFHLIRETLKL